MDDFLTEMADILEQDSVVVSDRLQGFASWDSLAVLSVIAMVNSDFGISLSSQEVTKADTLGDLFDIILAKKAAA